MALAMIVPAERYSEVEVPHPAAPLRLLPLPKQIENQKDKHVHEIEIKHHLTPGFGGQCLDLGGGK